MILNFYCDELKAYSLTSCMDVTIQLDPLQLKMLKYEIEKLDQRLNTPGKRGEALEETLDQSK